MRRTTILFATAALVASACGGGSSSPQAQTEEAAIEAATKAIRGTFVNNSGDVIDFLSEECRSNVDTGEVKQALALGQVFLQSDDYDLNDIQVTGTIKDFSPEAATVDVELIPPEGSDDLGFLSMSSDEVDVIYENGKWVGTECDFEDTAENDAADLQTELDAIGVAGTADDPAPASLAVPVGEGFTIAITDYTPDAAAMIEQLGGSAPFIEDGQMISLLAYDIAYNGEDEPSNLNSTNLQLVGSDGVGISQTSCGNMPDQTYFGSTEVFTGGSRSTVACFAAAPAAFPTPPIVSVEAGFSGTPVFFDAATPAAAPTSITGTSGPSPDGNLTDDRTAPNALGTAVDIGDGWTLTINAANLDAEADVIAANDFNDPAPDGQAYVLVDVTIAYDGDEASGSLFSVELDLVGDSNLSANSSCSASSIPNEIDAFSDLFAGGSVTGNLCFLADTNDISSLVAYATGEAFSDNYEFFSLA